MKEKNLELIVNIGDKVVLAGMILVASYYTGETLDHLYSFTHRVWIHTWFGFLLIMNGIVFFRSCLSVREHYRKRKANELPKSS